MMEYIKKIIKSCPEEVTETVHGEGPISGKDVARGARDGVPSCDSSTPATPVSEREGAARHSTHHCHSNHASE